MNERMKPAAELSGRGLWRDTKVFGLAGQGMGTKHQGEGGFDPLFTRSLWPFAELSSSSSCSLPSAVLWRLQTARMPFSGTSEMQDLIFRITAI